MNPFRTELVIDKNPEKLSYQSKILSLGSGFSHLIDEQFIKYGIQVNSNPFGTIYNPISLFNTIEIISNNEKPKYNFFTENRGTWNHYDFHQRVNSASRADFEQSLIDLVNETHTFYKKADFLFLTFGTAYAYKLLPSNHIVANCHKTPSKYFEKVLLTPEEIVDGFRKVYKSMNNFKDIVLVVSPVMHTKDSITLNAVSKSVLRLACHLIKNEFPFVKYFPAYEFLANDLRDYRFYEKDMIHPTEIAINYIFQKLVDAYFEDQDRDVILEIEHILESVNLIPHNPQGNESVQTITKAIEKLKKIDTRIDLTHLMDELNGMM